MSPLAVKGLLGVGIALALAAGMTYYTHIQRDIGRDEVRQEWAAATNAANEAERLRERVHSTKLGKIQDELSQKAQDLRIMRGRNDDLNVGLRQHTDRTAKLLQSADASACRDYAETLTGVFGECRSALVQMASDADQCSSVAWALKSAWPE